MGTVKPSSEEDVDKDAVANNDEVEPYDTRKTRGKVCDHFEERPDKTKLDEKIIIKPHPSVKSSDTKEEKGKVRDEEGSEDEDFTRGKRSNVKDYYPEKE